MEIRKVLIVYKKSSYERHVFGERDATYVRLLRERSVATRKSKRVHEEHLRTLREVKRVLRELGIPFDARLRYHLEAFQGYDLVVTVGGDGTFLEASHYLDRGLILGVNSAPEQSVGFFCCTTGRNFKRKMISLLKGEAPIRHLFRLSIEISGGRKKIPLVLNDILFANRNPAGTARYLLKIGKVREEQKSSGIWIAPAPGSTAAIRSAGGKTLPLFSEKFQFVVREPYRQPGRQKRLVRGVLDRYRSVRILSTMDDAAVYVDGPHSFWPVKRGQIVTIRGRGRSLNIVW